MKLMEYLPIVFVVLVAGAALALDDTPEYESVPKPEKRPVTVPVNAVPVEKSLSPNEALVADRALETATEAPKPNTAAARATKAPKPKAANAARKPPIVKARTREVLVHKTDAVHKKEAPRSRVDVEARHPSPDERLQHAVINAIARQPNLTGQVAVEARDAVVRLSGWTTTHGQSLRVEKAAARVEGVRQVVNEIRPRMGAVTS